MAGPTRTLLTTIYVDMRKNMDTQPSHGYHTKPFGKGGRDLSDSMSRWFPAHTRCLHGMQSQLSLTRVRGVKLHVCMSRTRVTTNVKEL